MAGWEEELASLLQELGVTQEEQSTSSRKTHKPASGDARKRSRVKCHEPYAADALTLGDVPSSDVVHEANDPWMDDLSLMRREVDSIVRQIVQLMQSEDTKPSLREDVMVVLRALRRRAMVTQQAATTDEAYLESASAMLHFCRLVLHISEYTAAEDA
jgi:Mg2+ and Co2+ transporter CorA